MKSSTSEDTPHPNQRGFYSSLASFPSFFGSDFATASCSSSSSLTSATASSLVSALYLIRTNDIAVLIRSLGYQL